MRENIPILPRKTMQILFECRITNAIGNESGFQYNLSFINSCDDFVVTLIIWMNQTEHRVLLVLAT